MGRFVDDSGTWGSGGMFNAVARLSSKVPEAYGAAHDAGDLHIGDFHLLPLSGIHYSSQHNGNHLYAQSSNSLMY